MSAPADPKGSKRPAEEMDESGAPDAAAGEAAAADENQVFFPASSKRPRSASWGPGSPFSETKSPDSTRSFTPSSEKNNKGLRHFSMKVCQKVKEKGVTTYNEVADELVQERQLAEVLATEHDDGVGDANEPHGPKNIRRRVYDALNVLMAMNIISKEKKEIRWIGLPNNSMQEYTHMEELRNRKVERIHRKKQHLHELLLQSVAYKNLLAHNAKKAAPEAGAAAAADPAGQVKLPFVIVNTSKDAAISCQMKPDKSEYFFDFDSPFEIHDDIEVLKRMGMAFGLETGSVTAADYEKAAAFVPPSLHPYLKEMVTVTDS
eukprot:m.446873 g.446873  ORF g.446873 m.446873 type:complete len:319 (-) comp19434_c0_seq1:134-1090(-)